MTTFLTDEEIADMCRPLKQPAAQLRHLLARGYPAERRPDGSVRLARAAIERKHDQPNRRHAAAPAWTK